MVTLNGDVMRINLQREVDDSYDIVGGKNALEQLREDVEEKRFGSKVAVIVPSYLRDTLKPGDLEFRGVESRVYHPDEISAKEALAIMGDMSKNSFGRDSVVLSIGNSYIAGFVAAYFNRGVNLITVQREDYVEHNFEIRCSNSDVGIKANKIPKRVYNLSGERNRHVELKETVDDSYNIVFANNIFENVAYGLAEGSLGIPRGSGYAIITDSNVKECQAGKLEEEMKLKGLETKVFSFEAGEPNKTFATCERVIQDITASGYAGCPILALGGGVVGDMAGFMAEMMGVYYIQLPTTVLALADSSVGGKTAVDTPYGKNLVGAFRQPGWVGIGTDPLETLNLRQFKSGFTEVAKHGVIDDNIFLNYMNRNVDEIMKRRASLLLDIAKFNCRVKGNIVEQDPHEKGPRRQLNYGHTFGHAIEKLSVDRFQKGLADDYLLHGEAVAVGMVLAGDIATHYGYPKEDWQLVNGLLQKLGQPIKIPEYMRDEDIMRVTTTDKKAKDGRARFTLPIKNGEMNPFDGAYVTDVDNDVVIGALNRAR